MGDPAFGLPAPRVQADIQRRQYRHIIADPAARDALLIIAERVAGLYEPAADSAAVAGSGVG
jgi:hypothetical protein